MPQLDLATFYSQILTQTFFFLSFFVFILTVVLPSIFKVKRARSALLVGSSSILRTDPLFRDTLTSFIALDVAFATSLQSLTAGVEAFDAEISSKFLADEIRFAEFALTIKSKFFVLELDTATLTVDKVLSVDKF